MCNVAIHGQNIPEEEAKEALDLAAEIIAVLRDVAGLNDATKTRGTNED